MLEEALIEFMKLVNLKPLQYLAAVRVAISVCESTDVQHMIGRFRNDGNAGFSDDQWSRLRGKAKRKLKQIFLPDIIIDNVLENLWPISFEISKWILYHGKDTGIECSSNFCWTPQINIDYTKTAEIMVKNETLDIKTRFKLACCYCIDFEVRSLWEQMNFSDKRSFFVRGNLKKSNQNPIVIYWTYYIQEVPIDFWDSKALNHSLPLQYAVHNGYLSATKYFFPKQNSQIRTRMISACFTDHLPRFNTNPRCMVKDHLAITCFLSCQLRSEIQGDIDFVLFFRYFLEWPMQKHFITVYDRLKGIIRYNFIFGGLMQAIIEKDVMDFKDHDYKELFMEVWRKGPDQYKMYVTDSEFSFLILMKFVKKHFGFIFEENSFTVKARLRAIVFHQEISEDATESGNVEFLKFLIREGVTTKTSVDRFTTNPHLEGFSIAENASEYSNLPLGELKSLIDGILGVV